MRALLALLALMLLGAAAPSAKPSFSCSGRVSPTEAAICADPELAAWDRAIAKVYRLTDRSDPGLAARQSAWLSKRDRCGAKRTCVLAAYRTWQGFTEPVSGVGLSLHRKGTDPSDPADLEVMQVYGSWFYFSIQALSIRDAEAGNVHDGSIAGVVELRAGKAKFDESPDDPYACRFRITRSALHYWTIDEEEAQSTCAGQGVYFSGEYRSS